VANDLEAATIMLKYHAISAAIALVVTTLIAQALHLWQSTTFLVVAFGIVYVISVLIGAFLKWKKTQREKTAGNAALQKEIPPQPKTEPAPPQP
jgi:glucose uptake protein GlcU